MKPFASLFLLFLTVQLLGQQAETQYAYGLFRGTHVINGHSVETQKNGELDMVLSHRFGRVNLGVNEMFGLDQASMRMGFEYGLSNRFAIGVGRSSVGKAYDGFAKFRLLRQRSGARNMPLSVTLFSGIYVDGTPTADIPVPFQTRITYANQVLIARKFSDRFSLQLMPTHLHMNLVDAPNDPNDIFSMGVAAKVQLTKNLALTSEYYYTLPNQLPADRRNALSIGLDINTGSHVFQIHFTNSSGMQENAFITNTSGNWGAGDIQFGFNMVRTFKLKGRRY